MRDTIFYSRSKKDVYSPKLFQIIENTPLAKKFMYYCVDCDKNTGKRNEDLLSILEIREVPTIIVEGQKFVGQEAFAWVKMMLTQDTDAAYPIAQQYPQTRQPANPGDFRLEPFQAAQASQYRNTQPQTHIPQYPNEPQLMRGMQPQMGMGIAPPQMHTGQEGNPNAGSGMSIGNGLQGNASSDFGNFADPFQQPPLVKPFTARDITQPESGDRIDQSMVLDNLVKEREMQRDMQIPQQQFRATPGATLPGTNMSMDAAMLGTMRMP